ncbi:MAG: XRE family transcriptional regulator [Chloroflexota bacterium]
MAANTEPNVGQRLRSLREQQGLSLRALSERSGLSVTAISQIEHGENSPTVASLHRLSNALHISITDLFQEEARQTTIFVKRELGLHSQNNGVWMESLGIGLFNQQLEPFRMVIQPNVDSTPDPISHPGEEFVHCLEGEIQYTTGARTFTLEKGDSLLFDATQAHAYHNQTDQQAVLLIVFLSSQDRQLIQQLHLHTPRDLPGNSNYVIDF